MSFLHDLKIAVRSLARARALWITVALTLALGIGANAAIFSIVRAVLLAPLANRDENRLLYVRQSAPGIGETNTTFSVPEIQDIGHNLKTIKELGTFSETDFSVIGLGTPREIHGGVVDGNYFEVMGLRPVLGRLLTPADDGPNASGAVVLTYRFWRNSMHSDPNVLGKTVRLESFAGARSATIVGVLEGVVERRRGAGTFVASPKIHFNKLMSYTEHMSSRGLSARSRVLLARIIEDEAEVAARLGLPATSPLVKIERLRETGDDPFALETCYLPAREFSALVNAPLGRTSLFGTLQHDYGVELAYADEEVDATAAEASVAELLGVPRGASVLRIRQVIYSTKGKATIYGVGFYRSERHTLFIRRFR